MQNAARMDHMGLQNHVNQRLRTSDCPLTFEFAEHALDDDPRPAQEFVPGTAPANVSQSDGSAIVAMEQSHSCRPVKATPAGKRFSKYGLSGNASSPTPWYCTRGAARRIDEGAETAGTRARRGVTLRSAIEVRTPGHRAGWLSPPGAPMSTPRNCLGACTHTVTR